MPDSDQVIVVTGQNDLLRDDETLVQFQAVIDKSLDVIQNLVYGKQELTIVKPLLPPDANELRVQKSDYFHSVCLTKSTSPTMPLTYITRVDGVDMDGIHPTVPGTQL